MSSHGEVRRRLLKRPPQLFAFRSQLLTPVLAVGLLGGLAGAAYLWALHGLQALLWPTEHAPLTSLGILTVAGLAIGLLTRWLGNPGDVELLVNNIHVIGRPEEPRSLRSLIPVSLLGIAVGGATGPEAPLVQTTGTLGSAVGLRGRRNAEEMRVLAITGMAAGFTVLFATPLGAAIFALEILHRRGLEYYEALLPAIIGSLSGYGISVAVGSVGLEPIFAFAEPVDLARTDLLWALAAGAVGALVAIVFTYLVDALRHVLARVPLVARTTLGGLALGLLGLLSPYALTFGEHQIDPLLASSMGVGALLGVGALKLLASAVTVTSGWRGGFIIPLFFVGAAVGRAGHLALGVEELVLVAALMAAANAGVTKTPLGSTIVVSEMAGMTILPTTLIATVVSLMLTSGRGVISSQRERAGSLPVHDQPPPPGPGDR